MSWILALKRYPVEENMKIFIRDERYYFDTGRKRKFDIIYDGVVVTAA